MNRVSPLSFVKKTATSVTKKDTFAGHPIQPQQTAWITTLDKWSRVNKFMSKRIPCCKLPDSTQRAGYFLLPCKPQSLDISCLFQLEETFVVTADILQCV